MELDLREAVAQEQVEVLVEVEGAEEEWAAIVLEQDLAVIVFARIVEPRCPIEQGCPVII